MLASLLFLKYILIHQFVSLSSYMLGDKDDLHINTPLKAAYATFFFISIIGDHFSIPQ